MTRRAPEACLLLLLLTLVPGLSGCASSWLRSKDQQVSLDELADEEEDESNFISRYTHPSGTNYVKVEAISLCTGLDGTGGDPPPTAQRAALMDEMKRQRVEDPNEVLSSPNTALVLVRSFMPPGIQKGDRFDIEVRTPTRSEATSLAGGWVLPARMTELAVLGNQVHTGHELAVCEGPILADGVSEGDEGEIAMTRGRILGGGVALKSRSLGLMIDRKDQSKRFCVAVAKSINNRFYAYRDGRRSWPCTPAIRKTSAATSRWSVT
jgi:flagellar basal body P-ring protein FlgI